jgi:NAD(P)H-hydrate epimerase
LVAARHLFHYGYSPTIYYPKRGKNELYKRLMKQLEDLNIPITEDFQSALKESDHVVDAIFGTFISAKIMQHSANFSLIKDLAFLEKFASHFLQ